MILRQNFENGKCQMSIAIVVVLGCLCDLIIFISATKHIDSHNCSELGLE